MSLLTLALRQNDLLNQLGLGSASSSGSDSESTLQRLKDSLVDKWKTHVDGETSVAFALGVIAASLVLVTAWAPTQPWCKACCRRLRRPCGRCWKALCCCGCWCCRKVAGALCRRRDQGSSGRGTGKNGAVAKRYVDDSNPPFNRKGGIEVVNPASKAKNVARGSESEDEPAS